ncbi:hypothetical protein K438DRAFT_1816137 [Mycena galopus ATCC 62051]|nr:hypothetical protein K438DRAFT_1816137 [Mycena galopus ATCC 62051]
MKTPRTPRDPIIDDTVASGGMGTGLEAPINVGLVGKETQIRTGVLGRDARNKPLPPVPDDCGKRISAEHASTTTPGSLPSTVPARGFVSIMNRREEACTYRSDANTAPHVGVETSEGLQLSLEGSWQSSPPAPESSSSMNLKRGQEAALTHYGDVHTAPDVMVQTRNGLQLLPGRAPSSQSASPRYPAYISNRATQDGVTRVGGAVQFVRGWRGTSAAGEAIPAIPKKLIKLPRREKAQGPLKSLPATAQDSVLLELQSLREEVRRLAAEREHPDTPPNYEP